MDKEKIRTIEEWKEPTTVKGIQSFLEFANVYRRFIKDYSKITAPLTRLTRKETQWKWDDKAQEAFEAIKQAMTTEPILRHFEPDKPITLETDASSHLRRAFCPQGWPPICPAQIMLVDRNIENSNTWSLPRFATEQRSETAIKVCKRLEILEQTCIETGTNRTEV